MAKKKKNTRGSKRGSNQRKPPAVASPDLDVDLELDAIIEHNMRARIATNVGRYSTAYLHQALAETNMAHVEAQQRNHKLNKSHAARIIDIIKWTLAQQT